MRWPFAAPCFAGTTAKSGNCPGGARASLTAYGSRKSWLQQTRAEAVAPRYEEFLSRFPAVEALAAADEEAVLKAWEGMGYYSRARNLRRAAMEVVRRGGFPQSAKELQRCRAWARTTRRQWPPSPLVRPRRRWTATRRACFRGCWPLTRRWTRRSGLRKPAEALIDRERPGDYNQALMDLGSGICTPRAPKCEKCPIKAFCAARAEGDVEGYPRLPAAHRQAGGGRDRGAGVSSPGRVLVRQAVRPRGCWRGFGSFPTILRERWRTRCPGRELRGRCHARGTYSRTLSGTCAACAPRWTRYRRACALWTRKNSKPLPFRHRAAGLPADRGTGTARGHVKKRIKNDGRRASVVQTVDKPQSAVTFLKKPKRTQKNQKEKAAHTSNITTSTQPERTQAVKEMLKQRREKQQQMELVIMEQMVPEDHFLRKVDRAVDFSFIYDLCAPLYCADNGRPAIDPEILFRMLLVRVFVRDQVRGAAEEEINYNIAYKWFCGTGFDRQGAGRDDDQPEPSPSFPGQQHCGRDFQRDSAAVRGEGAGGWSDPVYGFDAHQGEGEQAQEEAGGSSGSAEGISERTGRAGRSGT